MAAGDAVRWRCLPTSGSIPIPDHLLAPLMTPAKSFKKLRSASAAFLEDGGSLLHQIDDLLRDVQRCWQRLEVREQQLAARETLLQQMEIGFQQYLEGLSLRAQGEQSRPTQPMEKQPSETPARTSLGGEGDEIAARLVLERDVLQLQSAITGELQAASMPAIPRPAAHLSVSMSSVAAASKPADWPLPNTPGMKESSTAAVLAPLPSMVRSPRPRRRKRRQ
jgi:hypothetical protein